MSKSFFNGLLNTGNNVVYLHLVDSKKVIRTEEKFWFTPTKEIIDQIESLLGNDSVLVK